MASHNIHHAALVITTQHTQMFEEAGTDLAQALTQKDAIAKKKSAMPSNIATALARVSSGLYVVTAAHDNYRCVTVIGQRLPACNHRHHIIIDIITIIMQVGHDCQLGGAGLL